MDRMKLKVFRIKKELNQEELANLVGAAQQTISAYENGTVQPNGEMIRKLAVALDVEPGDLF